MKGLSIWIAFLACCFATEIKDTAPRLADSKADVVTVSLNENGLKNPVGEQGLLKRMQFDLAAQLNINARLKSEIHENADLLQYIIQGGKKTMENWVATWSSVMKTKQILSRKKINLDYSWLLMERCHKVQSRDEKIRRIADRLAVQKAEDVHPLARKHFLSKYLRLLKKLEEEVVLETRVSKGLSQVRMI